MGVPAERDAIASIKRIQDAQAAPMDQACQYVIALGYDPATDCVIEHHSCDGFNRRSVLVVRGVPAFEVATTATQTVDYTTDVIVTPKVLTWPERKS